MSQFVVTYEYMQQESGGLPCAEVSDGMHADEARVGMRGRSVPSLSPLAPPAVPHSFALLLPNFLGLSFYFEVD
jgi:hypothetical protein